MGLTTRRSVNGQVRVAAPTAPIPPAPPAARGAADPGEVVNIFSRAVNPREQYPRHFDLMMRELFALGLVPEEWQVMAADEVRLDEDGMEIEFMLLEPKTNLVRRCRVDVQQGQLVRIQHG